MSELHNLKSSSRGSGRKVLPGYIAVRPFDKFEQNNSMKISIGVERGRVKRAKREGLVILQCLFNISSRYTESFKLMLFAVNYIFLKFAFHHQKAESVFRFCSLSLSRFPLIFI